MPRIIFPLPIFERKLVKFLKAHPEMDTLVEGILSLLAKDMNTPSLKTHKLHGKMGKSYGCNITRQYRIVFHFDDKFIYLESVGSHDDVY